MKLIFTGFLFLINPDLITLDLLPDWIGYLLISKGLLRLSFLEERMAQARRWAHFLTLASVLKLISNLIVFTTTVESTKLTVGFVFFAAELWLSLMFISNAMKGIQYLAIRKDSTLALKGFEVVNFFLTSFFVLKSAVNFLPAAVAVFYPNIDADPSEVEGYTPMVRSYQTLRSIVFIIGAVVLVLFGIYVARVLWAYLTRIASDKDFCERLDRAYEEKVSRNEKMQTRLSVKSAFTCFFLSYLFLGCLYLDDIDFLPWPLFFFFAYLGFRSLGRQNMISSLVRRLTQVSLILSAGIYVYRTVLLFTVKDFALTFVRSPLALCLGLGQTVFTVLVASFTLKSIRDVAARWTGYRYRPYFVFLLLSGAALAVMGFFQYRYPSTFSILPAVQWCLWAVTLYVHKKSLDEIRDEIDYQLM